MSEIHIDESKMKDMIEAVIGQSLIKHSNVCKECRDLLIRFGIEIDLHLKNCQVTKGDNSNE